MKKVIVFDLDNTLAASKSAITDEMSEMLSRLLELYPVCVISGGKFEQFEKQLIANLKVSHELLDNLHIMPTCGTRYYRYDITENEWKKMYAEDLSKEAKKRIIDVIETSAKELGLWEDKTWGEIIEDRGSQITYSALGQQAPVVDKENWDPDHSKKKALRDKVAELIPEYEVRVGGTTSVDVTKLGIDKAYGMKKLMQELEVSIDEILFIGDKLDEGENDYPVKAMGADTISVVNYSETPKLIETIIKLSE